MQICTRPTERNRSSREAKGRKGLEEWASEFGRQMYLMLIEGELSLSLSLSVSVSSLLHGGTS